MSKHMLMIFALCGFTVLMGCGTTGALYIPEQRYPQKTTEEAPKAPETKLLETKTQKTVKE